MKDRHKLFSWNSAIILFHFIFFPVVTIALLIYLVIK